MKMTIKPNAIFHVWSADAAAECLNLSDETYTFLWENIVPRQKRSTSECPDDFERNALARFWRHVPDAMRRELNAAAADDEYALEYEAS